MPLLEVSDICKSFGGVAAVSGASMGAEAGEIVCLLGPSGCGKTTLLRLIAGLEAPDAGFIAFEGRVIDGLPPQERGFGLMFQDLALFPTMDVFGNVSFGLRMQKRCRGAQGKVSFGGSTSFWAWSILPGSAGGRSTSCRAANASGWRWPDPWRPNPGCLCLTNLLAPSTGGSGSPSRPRSGPFSRRSA